MKKRLLCLGLFLVMVFSFAACGKAAYDGTESGAKNNVELDTEKDNNETDGENGNVELDTDKDNNETDGENGNIELDTDKELFEGDFRDIEFSESVYRGIWTKNYDVDDALITSAKELNEFRNALQLKESVIFGPNYTGSRETVYTRITNQLDSYNEEYFKENVLIFIVKGASSGANDYTVKSVTTNDKILNVTLQYKIPAVGTCDFVEWCFLIDCKKGDFSKLNVVVETKYQQREASGEGFSMGFTNKASLETINHIYSPEDFPELDFDFTIEEYFVKSRDEVKQALSEGTADKAMQEYMQSYTRMFKINLTEKSKENVLRAVELLTQREEVKYVEPLYEYFFEED